MKYAFTSDFHAPNCAEMVLDSIYLGRHHFSVRIIHIGDLTVQDENKPLIKAARAAQKEAAEDKDLEKKLIEEYKAKVIKENYEGALSDVLYSAIGTKHNIDYINHMHFRGVINHLIIDASGNADKIMANDLNKVLGVINEKRSSGLDAIKASEAIKQIKDVEAIYDGRSAIVLVPYNTNKESWGSYEAKIRQIAVECKENGVENIVYASHERLGAERKAKMHEILDMGIVLLGEKNPNASILSIGGHVHKQEKPREYIIKTDGTEVKVIVHSTGLGNGSIYYQMYDPETCEMKEVEVKLSEQDKKDLEIKVAEELKRYAAKIRK